MNHIEYHEKALQVYLSLEEGTITVRNALNSIEALNKEAVAAGIPVTHTPTIKELETFVASVTDVANPTILAEDSDNGFYIEEDYEEESSYEDYDGSW